MILEPFQQFFSRERSAEEISLDNIATVRAKKGQLFCSFHSFRYNFHAEVVAYLDRPPYQCAIMLVRIHIPNETFVDLKLGCGYVLKLLHRRMARAKVVDR